MKKSILSLAAIVVLAVSTVPAHAAVSGSNPRPGSWVYMVPVVLSLLGI